MLGDLVLCKEDMQSFCLAEGVVSDLHSGLYSQRQINSQSPCSPVLACFILDLL